MLFKDLKKLGEEGKIKEITDLLTESDRDEVLDLLKSKIFHVSEGFLVFRWILQGCHAEPRLHDLRLRATEFVCSEIMTNSTLSNKSASELVSVLLFDLDGFSSPHLVRIVTLCIEQIQSNENSDLLPRWSDIFAKIMCIVGSREVIVDDDDEATGPEYKARVIRSVCIAKWQGKNVASIASMFREIPLKPEELTMVLEKVASSLKKMEPQEIPPVVYQTLLLTRDSSSPLIIEALRTYFTKKAETANADEMASADLIGDSGDCPEATLRAEGTVMFHIAHAVRLGHPIAKEILKMIRSSAHTPEVVLSPFMLFLAFSLTTVKAHQQVIVELIKSAITKSLVIGHRRTESAWFRSVTPCLPEIARNFSGLIRQVTKFGGFDLIGQGVVDLAMMLLDTLPGLGKPDEKLRETWALGSKILQKVFKSQSEVVDIIVKQLINKIVTSQAATQYTDCLGLIVKDGVNQLAEKSSIFNDLLEQLVTMNIATAKRVLVAILPLIKVNRSLRDATMLVLRKALFSPRIETRQVAISGVLHLLKHFRISSSLPVTQLSQSSSGLSQIAVDIHRGKATPNEALCAELLGVLRRGFYQHAKVRLTLYQGLYDVVCRNPELCLGVLDMLNGHELVQTFLRQNANGQINPLDMEQIIGEDDGDAFVIEPVGYLIHCIQLVVSKGQQLYSDDSPEDVSGLEKLSDFLDDLVQKYSGFDLMDLNLEKNAECSRATKTGLKNALIVDSLKNVYEALMEYMIARGVDVDEDRAKQLLSLFRMHHTLSELLAASSKGPKKGSKENKQDKANKTENKGTTAKASKLCTTKGQEFIVPEHAFSLKAISIILRSVLIDHNPSHQSALSQLRSQAEFMVYLFRITNAKQRLLEKSLGYRGEDGASTDLIFRHLAAIGSILSENTLYNSEVQESTVLLSLECLLQNMMIMKSFFPASKLFNYWADLDPKAKSDEDAISRLATKVMEKITMIHDKLGEDEEDEDAEKLIASFFKLLTFLFREMKPEQGCERTEQILKKGCDWIRRYAETSCTSNQDLMKPVLELLLATNAKCKANSNLYLDLARDIHSKIGDLEQSIQTEEAGTFSFITSDSGDRVGTILITHMEHTLDLGDAVVARCRSNPQAVTDTELSLCQLMARIINALGELVQSGFRPGPVYDYQLKVLVKLYSSMSGLAKYFFQRCRVQRDAVVTSRFDKVVRLIGGVTKTVYTLITYIETKQKEQQRELAIRRKVDSAKTRVLKEAKNIPQLIFKIEAFEKDLIRLSSRCKTNLLEGLKLSTSRDFRFNAAALKEIQDQDDDDVSDNDSDGEQSNVSSHHAAESTRLDGARSSQSSQVSATQRSVLQAGMSQKPEEEPPKKKLKVKMGFKKK